MNRDQKAELVEELSGRLKKAPLIALADYRFVTVPEITQFRETLRESGIGYEVVKNTLVRRAIKGTPMEGISKYLTGMTGIIISNDDPIATVKTLRVVTKDLAKKEHFSIKGGYFDGDALDGTALDKVGDLPSKEELQASLLRLLQEGPRQVLGVIQGPARDLVTLLRNHEHALSEGAAE